MAGLPPLSYFPASQSKIIGWLGSLFDGDSVRHTSLKVSYFAVNQFMADIGFPQPCLEHHVQLKAIEAQRGRRVWARGSVSAPAIYQVILLGLTTADPELLHTATGVFVCFAFCLRSYSLVFVKEGNLSLRGDGLHLLAGGKPSISWRSRS